MGQHLRLLRLDSPLGKDILLPQRLVATEHLSQGYEVSIDVLATQTGIALEPLIAQPVTLWIRQQAGQYLPLRERINSVIARYKKEKKRCEKVILVTHSMGGLVARYCSEVLGMSDKILGIVHGVMPAIGAAAVYRRFKSGTEGGWLAAKVLGEDAAEMTAVLSSAPGPLQLLPTPEYGNGWLRIDDGSSVVSLPRNNDPYNEIYTVRGRWWSMCEDHLITPRTPMSQARQQREIDADWAGFSALIQGKVREFHLEPIS
ncbi:hypothetical protein HBDW_44610 [Herbaspirillum sp. DW155]|uniref:esterase/lipase family protein n=1 Tax=Herbaspirillum sp. DW155 TaxID=3095609 RepID=UPI0030859429|nr:hypothetical protein HBDW_44610 [Herbaspirillum sp. DW155]